MGNQKIDTFKQDLLSFKKIGVDSMIFIYQFADDPTYAPLTTAVFELLEQGKIEAVTSTITIVEVFVQAEKEKNQLIISEYEKVFQNMANLEILPIDWNLTRVASKLRAYYANLRTPDALQISAALLKDYSVFLTNDRKLKQIHDLKILSLKDYL